MKLLRSLRAALFAALPAAALFIASGCYYYGETDDTDDDVVLVTPDSIYIQEELYYSSGGTLHYWNSPGGSARVTLMVDDYYYGDVKVFIYDAVGDVIYVNSVDGGSGYWYSAEDDENFEIGFTGDGVAGAWTILIDYEDFRGDVTVIVEAP